MENEQKQDSAGTDGAASAVERDVRTRMFEEWWKGNHFYDIEKRAWPTKADVWEAAWEAACSHAAERLRKAGATLPAPDATGTVEGAVTTGLCVALALVEGMSSNDQNQGAASAAPSGLPGSAAQEKTDGA